jgi:hypothetical protein
VRKRRYSDDARRLLILVWSLMGRPNSKYFAVMRHEWMPLLQAGGDLQQPFASEESIAEMLAMSAASIERYLAPVRRQFEIKGISATKPDPAMRNSIAIRTLMDDTDWIPGMVEADTVVHCGPTLRGECARTLTVTDMNVYHRFVLCVVITGIGQGDRLI